MLLNTEPRFDFIVRISELQNAGGSHWYKDIYEVSLNNRIQIYFLPPLGESELVFDLSIRDQITSRKAALMEIIRTAEYCVIPNDQRAHKVVQEIEEAPTDAYSSDLTLRRIIFFEPVASWNQWKQEFDGYHETLAMYASELEQFHFMKFLRDFISSIYIHPRDLKSIGR